MADQRTGANEVAGLAAQAAALAEGRATSIGLVEAALARAHASQDTVGAFRLVRDAAARRDAEAADRALAAGDRRPLLGVPIAVKDDTDTEGDDTRFGCAVDVSVHDGDGPLAARLRAAGAVIVGKATTCEFGQWPFTSGPAFGVTRNPWSLGYSPGGSSGGSAAAVAAGIVPAAVGSDGAGSVRIPAAWTHLVGIKPPTGMVPGHDGALGFHGITVNGPLARSVGDAALLLDVMADTGDTVQRAARAQPGPLRIGVALRPPFVGPRPPLDPEVRSAVEGLAVTLAQLGHQVRRVHVPWSLAGPAFLPRSTHGVHTWASRVPDPDVLDPRTRENARTGSVMGGPPLAAAMAGLPRLRGRVGRLFDDVDVVLAPTTASPPLPVDTFDGLSGLRTDVRMARACPYTFPWNVLGWPGVNVPAGRTRAGLPVGAQLLGPDGTLELLVSVAAQLEGVRHWDRDWPPTRVEIPSGTAR